MKNMRCISIALAMTLFVGISGCASMLSVDDVAEQSDLYLGKKVSVVGYIGVDNLNVPHLYKSLNDAISHRDIQALDLVSDDRYVYQALHFSTPGCAVVNGDFHVGGKDYLVTGSFVSQIGFIKVSSFEKRNDCEKK